MLNTPPRVIQHRPKRDSRKAKEAADLRRENHQLKRMLSQLRRRVEELVDQGDGYHEPTPVPAPQGGCPECLASEVMTLTTPGGRTIQKCRKCIWYRDG